MAVYCVCCVTCHYGKFYYFKTLFLRCHGTAVYYLVSTRQTRKKLLLLSKKSFEEKQSSEQTHHTTTQKRKKVKNAIFPSPSSQVSSERIEHHVVVGS